jgi:hypothetical protein
MVPDASPVTGTIDVHHHTWHYPMNLWSSLFHPCFLTPVRRALSLIILYSSYGIVCLSHSGFIKTQCLIYSWCLTLDLAHGWLYTSVHIESGISLAPVGWRQLISVWYSFLLQAKEVNNWKFEMPSLSGCWINLCFYLAIFLLLHIRCQGCLWNTRKFCLASPFAFQRYSLEKHLLLHYKEISFNKTHWSLTVSVSFIFLHLSYYHVTLYQVSMTFPNTRESFSLVSPSFSW